MLLGLFLLLAGSTCVGQISIQLPAQSGESSSRTAAGWEAGKLEFQETGLSGTSMFDQFRLPSHVETNPRGYSPLCRLELRIEDKLPVGVWVKLGEKPLTPSYLRSNAEVRFKLFRF